MSLPVLASEAEGFHSPDQGIFWQPLFGTEGAWAVTRPSVVLILSVFLIILVLELGTRRLSVVPGRGQAMVESVYGIVRNSVGRDILGEERFRRFMPLLFGLFTVILLNNLFGIIPPVQYPTMSRIAFPAAFALVVYFTFNGLALKRKGLGGYIKGLVPSGLPAWIVPIVLVLELVTWLITRPVTLALRLFGNMFAGHIILVLFISGAEYMLWDGGAFLKVVSVPTFLLAFVMTLFELLVEFLQAYVFVLLTATYIADAYADEH